MIVDGKIYDRMRILVLSPYDSVADIADTTVIAIAVISDSATASFLPSIASTSASASASASSVSTTPISAPFDVSSTSI